MPYDEQLAQRFRDALADRDTMPATTEKNMMGGICFFVNGNMLGGASKTKDGEPRFMLRVGKELEELALAREGAMPVVLGKRRMGGMVFVEADKCNDRQLTDWILLALKFVGELPAKP